MATGRIPGTSGSPLTAKGDIFAYSTTASRLPVGSDGQTLVANSAATTGLQWQTPVQQNPILNSAFQVWQRGTSIAVAASSIPYTADRWQIATGVNQAFTVSRQATGDTTNLPNIQYCARVQRNSGQTGTGDIAFVQSFESINSIPFAGKSVVFSFYARAGANFSGLSTRVRGVVATGTGTDQNRTIAVYTGETQPIILDAVLTTTWQRFTGTGTIPATATEIGIVFATTPTGTAGTNDYFEITGVQLEVGSVATPFHTFSTTLQGELAACQRYYWRTTPGVAGSFSNGGSGFSTTLAIISIKYPTTMRIKPTSFDYSGLEILDYVNAAAAVTSAAIGDGVTTDLTTMNFSVASGLTQYRPYFVRVTSAGTGYLGFNAEL